MPSTGTRHARELKIASGARRIEQSRNCFVMAIFTQRCLPSFATVATVAAVLAGLTGEPLGATTTSPPGAVVRRAMAYNATEAGSSYLGYRIPSAVVARNGDLLVFAEGRAPRARPGARGNLTLCYGQPASLYDWKCYAKDIVARRSTDQGGLCLRGPVTRC